MGKASLLFVGNFPFGMLALATAADLNPQNPLMIVVERELHFTSDEGYGTRYGPAFPSPKVYPAQSADVRWNGMQCPWK